MGQTPLNVGRFWRGSARPVIGLDINPRYRPTLVGDHERLPLGDGCMDVVVYDPPHIPNQGTDRTKDFTTRFGLGRKASAAQGSNLSHLYRAFVSEASRVLKAEGILLCKITDYVHTHRFQWAHIAVKEPHDE